MQWAYANKQMQSLFYVAVNNLRRNFEQFILSQTFELLLGKSGLSVSISESLTLPFIQ